MIKGLYSLGMFANWCKNESMRQVLSRGGRFSSLLSHLIDPYDIAGIDFQNI
jgi:hypothetical protein